MPENKCNPRKNHSQIEAEVVKKDIEHLKKFSSEDLFQILIKDKKNVFSEHFKSRFHKLCIEGTIRAQTYYEDMRPMNSMKKKGGKLKCLEPYDIRHEHIDNYYDGFLAQLNHFLKKNKIQFEDGVEAAQSITEFTDKNLPLTGHWLVYKIHNETRYYLDICEHGADEYLKNEGLPIYKEELPELFNQ